MIPSLIPSLGADWRTSQFEWPLCMPRRAGAAIVFLEGRKGELKFFVKSGVKGELVTLIMAQNDTSSPSNHKTCHAPYLLPNSFSSPQINP